MATDIKCPDTVQGRQRKLLQTSTTVGSSLLQFPKELVLCRYLRVYSTSILLHKLEITGMVFTLFTH